MFKLPAIYTHICATYAYFKLHSSSIIIYRKEQKNVTVDFLFSFPPPIIPENLTKMKRNRVKFLSLSWISRKHTSTADRWCSTYPLIRHTRNDIIYNATKIITNSLNWNGRAGGMASVIYGSQYGRARRWSGVNRVHRST